MTNSPPPRPILAGEASSEEARLEPSLRPQKFQEFIGQDKLKSNLDVFVRAAKNRKEALDHCLFSGPPGLGKTTLAHIIGHEMGVNVRQTSGPVMDRVGDLAAILTNLGEGDVLFIDEIHRLNHAVEEALYPAMEDFALDIIIGEGPSAKTIKLPLPRFTLVGATTRPGLLSSPLRDRFGIVAHLEYYAPEEVVKILDRSGKILSVQSEPQAVEEIARRSRGTPRIANRLLRRLRDFAQVRSNGRIDLDLARQALESLEVDAEGLDQIDRKILSCLAEKFNGGPVGVDTLAVAISEDRETLEDVYEPFLIKAGFLARTPRGRVCLPKTYQHLGLPMPPERPATRDPEVRQSNPDLFSQ